MSCGSVLANAERKMWQPIWRQRETKTEAKKLFTWHALISTRLSPGFREGRTADEGTAGGGWGVVRGNIWTWTLSDQMPHYEVNASFFFFFYSLFSEDGQSREFSRMNHACQMASVTCKGQADVFHFNHLWLMIDWADCERGPKKKKTSFVSHRSVHIQLIVWENVCQNH